MSLMRKETIERDGQTCHLRRFDDWLDFISHAERIERDRQGTEYNGMECVSLSSNDPGWYGTNSLAEAIQLAKRGWPEGREKVREVRRRMRVEKLRHHAFRTLRDTDVSGDEPDIDLFLQNEPEHMFTIYREIDTQPGKVFRAILDCSWSAWTPSEQIVRRGVALLAAFEAMLTIGYTVEVTISEAITGYGSSERYESYVPVLHAGDPLNLDTLAYMFISPSVLRRLYFAVEELEPPELRKSFGFYGPHNGGGGYGHPKYPSFLEDADIPIRHDEGLVSRDEDILPISLSILRRVGIEPDATE